MPFPHTLHVQLDALIEIIYIDYLSYENKL